MPLQLDAMQQVFPLAVSPRPSAGAIFGMESTAALTGKLRRPSHQQDAAFTSPSSGGICGAVCQASVDDCIVRNGSHDLTRPRVPYMDTRPRPQPLLCDFLGAPLLWLSPFPRQMAGLGPVRR